MKPSDRSHQNATMSPWIVGNWKMNGSLGMLAAYVPALLAGLGRLPGWEGRSHVALCPPFPYLGPLAERLRGTAVGVGAQNVHPQPNGAYTGEVAAAMLTDVGAGLCLVGHSERRQYYRETDALVREKLAALLAAEITPILCVGETLAQRQAGRAEQVVQRQVAGALRGLAAGQAARLVLAYEPVWAIGTGLNATPEQANEMHRHIRTLLARRFGAGPAGGVPLLYGGSVKPDNAAGLIAQPEINGMLVGGASLKAEIFLPIIQHSLA